VSRFDLPDPYYIALSLSWPTFALAALLIEVAANILFASLYLEQPGSIANARPGSFGDAWRGSKPGYTWSLVKPG